MKTYEILVLLLLLLSSFTSLAISSGLEREGYIVHLQHRDDINSVDSPNESDILSWHRSFLPESVTTNSGERDGPRLVYSYTHVFPGFAARLTDAEAKALQDKPGVLRLYPDRELPLATTHSPDFLGLRLGNAGFWNLSGFGKGVVIGILDTGILPNHPSFNDEGVPPPPAKWKGTCEFRSACNNKIIGARAFGSAAANATAPPFDDAGHGTHTASTAAGNFVKNANVGGNADGTASGMAPHAHLAIYKVCSRSRCSIMDIIAGMDAAVKDGVDVLSFSIGASAGVPFNYDSIAIASFQAMKRGIFVSCAAGNAGPSPGTVGNEAPWVLTVAAGTMDRAIRATVRLGNGQEFDGESLYQPTNFSSSMLQLVYPGGDNDTSSRECSSLGSVDVRGKIVLCESSGLNSRLEQGGMVHGYGGTAMIVMNRQPEGYTTFADAHVLPASHVSYDAGSKILQYISSTSNPTASIVFKGTVIGPSIASTIAFFSSRGPGKASPGILKPDITGPGMNILAAWAPNEMHPAASDVNELTFNIESGTSMSTPHLSGIAALVKSVHPRWSPAAIKSAIMTTSDVVDHTGLPIKDEQYRKASFFAMGAGYVNAQQAINPGLIYDIHVSDYIAYLCGLGLGDEGVTAVAHRRTNCSNMKSITEAELNYPSIVFNAQTQAITVNRTVTNVGKAKSVYRVVIDMPQEVLVTVQPQTLVFSKVNQKMSFGVTVALRGGPVSSGAEGNLKWVSDEHVVRSSIVVPARS